MELSAEDQTALDAVQAEFDRLTDQHQTAEELPDDVDVRFGELEAEIERLEAKRHAYDPDDVARSGAFVVLSHDGTLRVERGFIRPEDEKSQAAQADGRSDGNANGAPGQIPDGEAECEGVTEDDGASLSDILVGDLTAYRTLGLRLNLSEQPDIAVVVATHALAAQVLYVSADLHVVGIKPVQTDLSARADGIEDSPAGKAWTDRHANWARQMPRDSTILWDFVAELDHDSRMSLFAHCVALTVNAVKLPWEQRPRVLTTADRLASAVSLEMTGYWRPTVRSYLGRITKAHILGAIRESVGPEAAERLTDMKKTEMAEAAEQLLAGTGWLPALLRTAKPREDQNHPDDSHRGAAYPEAAE